MKKCAPLKQKIAKHFLSFVGQNAAVTLFFGFDQQIH